MTSVSSHSPLEIAEEVFSREFGGVPAAMARAPGRVNVIGEHVDYNDGYVLPAALELEVCIACRPREDGRVRLHAVTFQETVEFELAALRDGGVGSWIDYVAGPASILLSQGHELRGFDGVLASSVPVASGLSSSAAVEVASLIAFRELAGLKMPEVECARIAQRAENAYVGVSCGIMDQFISVLGRKKQLLLIDCLTLDYEHVPLPAAASLVIADSSASRSLAASAYNERVQECAVALSELRDRWPQIRSWRDVQPDQVDGPRTPLTGAPRRRARHVVGEIARTLDAVSCLRNGDVEAVGGLMKESHASLRDDFQVSSPALDSMTEVMDSHPDCLGARLTGAGFGGCAVALARAGSETELAALIAEEYPVRSGLQPKVYQSSPGAGATWTVL